MEIQAPSSFLIFLSVGILTSVWPALGQECPLLFPPSAVVPSQAYNFSSSAFQSLFTSLNSSIENYIAQHRIPSYAVAVVVGNQTIYTSGLPSTPFRIGSITKTVTTLSAFLLREQGRLSLDDPVKKFLPSFSIINPFGRHDTRLRELMGHAAGFPRELCPMLMTCTDNETEILGQIAGMQLISRPWSSSPAYSNLGISLLGRTLEKATFPSMAWEEFVVEMIAKPLGMTNTGVNLTNVKLAPNNNPYAKQDLGWSAPAAQMYSTANDLGKYLAFLLTAEPPLIADSSIREWISPATIFSDGKAGYAFPWELRKLNDRSSDFLITKAGEINGYVSHIAFDPTTEVGVVVLAVLESGTSSGDPGQLADNVLETVMPALEAVNEDMIAAPYNGVYTCNRSPSFAGPTLNYTVQVVEGTINVYSSPTVGLLANVSLSLLNAGLPVFTGGTWALLLKNGTENSFWFGDGMSCLGIVGAVSSGPDLIYPNTPGSLYTNVVTFNLTKGSILWPAVGAECYKGAPSKGSPHSPNSFVGVIFSFLLFFFIF